MTLHNLSIQSYISEKLILQTYRCDQVRKEALEAVLFEAQTNLEASEINNSQLEKEQKDLIVKQEQLKAQVTKLTKELERSEKKCIDTKNSLTQAAGNKEMEYKQIIDKLKQQNEDNIKKLTDERESIRVALEKTSSASRTTTWWGKGCRDSTSGQSDRELTK
nr:unnamed protein product [Callosobruchus analis]